MLEQELADMEQFSQTEAELIDQQSKLGDVEDDLDELLGPNVMESDMTRAYDSFISASEGDYNGFDPSSTDCLEEEQEIANMFYGGGYHIEVAPE